MPAARAMGRGSSRVRTERGAGATQMVVGIMVVVAFLSVGPWFAGVVGGGLTNLLYELAQPADPCPTASAKPGARPKRDAQRSHERRPTRPMRSARPSPDQTPPAKGKPSPTTSSACSPAGDRP